MKAVGGNSFEIQASSFSVRNCERLDASAAPVHGALRSAPEDEAACIHIIHLLCLSLANVNERQRISFPRHFLLAVPGTLLDIIHYCHGCRGGAESSVDPTSLDQRQVAFLLKGNKKKKKKLQ